MEKPKEALLRACKTLGGQTNLAAALSKCTGERVTNKNIWSWLNSTKSIPPRWALPIEEVTRHAVDANSRLTEADLVFAHEIAPDCYPRGDHNIRQASCSA